MTTIQWNLGNFTVNVNAELPEELKKTFLEYGLTQVCQRQSEVDKVLGGYTTDIGHAAKVKGQLPGGKGPWRRAGYTRGDVAFTPELAEKLSEVFRKLKVGESSLNTTVSVVPYETTAAEIKHAEARKAMDRHESANDLEAWLLRVIKYSGPTHTEDGEDFHGDALCAITAFIKTL